jgi:hypothetical protein
LASKNIARFSSATASGPDFRAKYQHFGLNLSFKSLRSYNFVCKYDKKLDNLILRGQNLRGKQKIWFVYQSSFKVNRNTVLKLKNV